MSRLGCSLLLLAVLAQAWSACSQASPANASSSAGSMGGQRWGPAATDLTVPPGTTVAFTTVAFGVSLPRFTPRTFAGSARAQFEQALRAAFPGVDFTMQALPGQPGALVSVLARFPQGLARTAADALVIRLTTPGELQRLLPGWAAQLAYTTFPILASAAGGSVSPALGQQASLQFTVRLPGTSLAAFNWRLVPWINALKAAAPGLADQGIALRTTEVVQPLAPRAVRVTTLAHVQVVGPSLPALRRLAARLLHDPQSIWARKYFGASDVAPPSTWLAYVPPCGGPGCAAWGWGNNLFGELGDGTTTDRWAPVRSAPGRGYVAINAGKDFTCALLPSGGADCFGQNNWGQLGDGTLATSRPTPAPVETNGSVYTALACGDSHACSLLADGGAACWGMNSYGNLGIGDAAKKYNLVPVRVQAAPGSIYVAISAAGRHTCALRAEGAADCWGQNADGVLGDGTTTNRPSPVRVLSAPGRVYVAIATGGTHTCALVAGGSEIDCWGSNELHQLGDGTTNAHWTPVRVQTPPGRAYKALAAGEAHTCALLADGSGADCWGFNGAGQLGIGTYDQPATPVRAHTAPGRVYVGIAAAGEHTCALASDSGADCWGRGAAGQLGDGKVTDSPAPVQVDAPGVKFVSLAAGGDFTIGLAAV